jgi:hypothetical protein
MEHSPASCHPHIGILRLAASVSTYWCVSDDSSAWMNCFFFSSLVQFSFSVDATCQLSMGVVGTEGGQAGYISDMYVS